MSPPKVDEFPFPEGGICEFPGGQSDNILVVIQRF